MAAYYNEFDPFAAEWLTRLIGKGLIADGEVDSRSITDVQSEDLKGFTQCHFFAGVGGWSYAARLAGWNDDRPMWTGSAPCQPFSNAGKREGKTDERHLWPELFRLIRGCKPTVIFGEQVPGAVGQGWLCELATDMQKENYETASIIFKGSIVGADHSRERLYWVCDSGGEGWEGPTQSRKTIHWANEQRQPIPGDNFAYARRTSEEHQQHILQRDGIPLAMERKLIKGYGNAIIPQAAALFIKSYMELKA